jgi:hypothetical protein
MHLSSQNEARGFFGAVNAVLGRAAAETGWAEALAQVADATGCTPEAARLFLDSRFGRQFADDALHVAHRSGKLDVAEAVGRWMRWTTKLRTEQQYGIPRGLPHLVGFVRVAALAAEG